LLIRPEQFFVFRRQLQGIFKTRNYRTIFVQADDELLFNDVAQLIDAANRAGAGRIGLMTEQITSR
jgi:biopolymer transport protein ExbD